MLPFRTHPEMATTGTGGYLLSGIKVHVQPSEKPAVTQSEPPGTGASLQAIVTESAGEPVHVHPVVDVVAEPAEKKLKTDGLRTHLPASN